MMMMMIKSSENITGVQY